MERAGSKRQAANRAGNRASRRSLRRSFTTVFPTGFSRWEGVDSMTTDTLTELSQVSFFEEFLPRHMEKLTSLGSEVHFNKDEIIFRENQDSKVFYVILSGRIALEANVAGQTYCVQTLYASDVIGWSTVLNRKKPFQARALDPVRVLAY